MVLKGVVQKAWRLSPVERRMVVEALVALAVARFVLMVFPFAQAMARLGLHPRFEKAGAQAGARSDQATVVPVVRAVQHAVTRGCKVAPFRAVCLQQAVAASLMLGRRGLPADVHFGVAKDDLGVLSAHAWCVSRETVVTGEKARAGFVPIGVFAR